MATLSLVLPLLSLLIFGHLLQSLSLRPLLRLSAPHFSFVCGGLVLLLLHQNLGLQKPEERRNLRSSLRHHVVMRKAQVQYQKTLMRSSAMEAAAVDSGSGKRSLSNQLARV